jgi:hypothetical protein
MKLTIPERPGVCRWCGCTYHDPCPPGCSWANRQQTLCSECVAFDTAMRTKAGRRHAVETFNIGAEAIE